MEQKTRPEPRIPSGAEYDVKKRPMPQQLPDVNDALAVELEISSDGRFVYFNVDGITVQRCVDPQRIIVTDNREGPSF